MMQSDKITQKHKSITLSITKYELADGLILDMYYNCSISTKGTHL